MIGFSVVKTKPEGINQTNSIKVEQLKDIIMASTKDKISSRNMDLQWQAESDATTMANYQEIIGDKARMNRAIKAARAKAADFMKRANAIQNAIKVKSISKRK